MVVADDWGEFGSFNVAPYAVVKIDGGASSPDYYQLAVKIHEVYSHTSETNQLIEEERVEWEIFNFRSMESLIRLQRLAHSPSFRGSRHLGRI